MRTAGDEAEAAYFTLLRARDELAAVIRYAEWLNRERDRLDRFLAEGVELDATVDARERVAREFAEECEADLARVRAS